MAFKASLCVFAFFTLTMTDKVASGQDKNSQSIPIATQWLLDTAQTNDRIAVTSVFKIWCTKTSELGTGFALDTGYIITDEHVVRKCDAPDLEVISSAGERITVSSLVVDSYRDLAAMTTTGVQPGLRIEKHSRMNVGSGLSTWGYPFGIDGPAPLWTIGYLSGYNYYKPDPPDPAKAGVKHLIVSGAFNPGNSGGPLIAATGGVVGVVVNKRLFSMTPFLTSAIESMAKNASGVTFVATDSTGNKTTFVESQLVAELLKYYRDVSQVYIGEAIASEELIDFLDSYKIPWHSTGAATPTKEKANRSPR
jgi:S1-C subfamily serine protease